MTYAILALGCAVTGCNSNSSNDNMATNDMIANDVMSNDMMTNDMGSNAMMGGNAAAAANVDSDFVTSSIKGDTAELAIAHLASTKGTTQGVKDLATMIIADHGAHKQKLIDLANSAGIAVPTEGSDSGQAQLQTLQGLSGTAFDKAYAQMMVENHKMGIAKNEAEAKKTGPAAELAQATLPVLKKHLAAAEAL
jgi:putative membrane protein